MRPLTTNSENYSVHVNFLGPSQDDVGTRKMIVGLAKPSSLKDLLLVLASKIGQKFQKFVFNPSNEMLNEEVTIIINGRHYTALDGLETILASGDDISIFPPLGGG